MLYLLCYSSEGVQCLLPFPRYGGNQRTIWQIAIFVWFRQFVTELQRKKRISSAIRPVPHTEDLPVLEPPQQYILDSDEEPTENQEKTPQPSTSTDSDFTAGLQCNEFHRITQEDLNDLIRDLTYLKIRLKTATMEPSERKCQNFSVS